MSSSSPARRRLAGVTGAATVAAALLVPIVAGPAAAAETFIVTTTADVLDGTDGVLSLREAVQLASDTDGADTVVLAAGAVYTLGLCSGTSENANLFGDLDHNDDHPLTIVGSASTIRQTCPDRVLHATHPDGDLVLRGVVIRGGDAAGAGGGVLTRGSLTLVGSTVTANTSASTGGGVRTEGDLLAVDATISANEVTGLDPEAGGGGARVGGDATVVRSVVRANEARGGPGGGLQVAGDVDVHATVVEDNDAGAGGGGLRASGPAADVRITDSALRGNDGDTGPGGAVRAAGSVLVERSEVLDNTTDQKGAGLYLQGEAAGSGSVVRDSLLDGNVAGNTGGGLHVELGSAEVVGATFVDNGGGLRAADVSVAEAAGPVTVAASALGRPRAAAVSCSDDAETRLPVSAGGNVAHDPTCTSFTAAGDAIGVGDVGLTDRLASAGLRTQRHAVEGGAVDGAVPAGCGPVDQRGATRPASGCDTGAATVCVHTAPPVPESGFADVVPGSFYDAAVDVLVVNEITTGTSATTFAPDEAVTRGQMATFLGRTGSCRADAPDLPSARFDDVAAGAFFAGWVDWLAAARITTGTGPTTFAPDEAVTRGQMATFLWRFAGSPDPAGPSGFADVPPGAFYADAVAWLQETAITTGTSPTTFAPDEAVTRGQMAAFLARLLVELDHRV